MDGQRTLAWVAALAVLLGACGASPSPVPTETPGAASAERCAGLHWFDVRDALLVADHYTYRSTDHIAFVVPPSTVAIATDRTVAGAYQAPDRARETSEWAAGTVFTPGMLSYPDFTLIGDRQWLRVFDGTGLFRDEPGRLGLTPKGGALDDLLASLQARASWSPGGLDPGTPTACLFTITSAATDDGRRFDASLWADATTLLPTRILRSEVADEAGSVSTFDTTIEPTGQDSIEAPGPDEIAVETPQP